MTSSSGSSSGSGSGSSGTRTATPAPNPGTLAELNASSTPLRLSPDLRGPASAVGSTPNLVAAGDEDDEADLSALTLPPGTVLDAHWPGFGDDDLAHSLSRLHDRPAMLHSHTAGPTKYRQPLASWARPDLEAPRSVSFEGSLQQSQSEDTYCRSGDWASKHRLPCPSSGSGLPPPDATSALLSALTAQQELAQQVGQDEAQYHAAPSLQPSSMTAMPHPGSIRRHISFDADLTADAQQQQQMGCRARAATFSTSAAPDAATVPSRTMPEDLDSLMGRHHRQLSATPGSTAKRPTPPPPSYGARLDAPSLNRLQSTFFNLGGPTHIPLKPEAALGLARLEQIHRSVRGGSREAVDSTTPLPSPGLLTMGLPTSLSPSFATGSSSYFSALPSPASSSNFSQEPMPYSDEWWRLNEQRFLSTLDASSMGPSEDVTTDAYRQSLAGQLQLASDSGSGLLATTPGKVAGQGPSPNNRKYTLYKTELCRSWEEKGNCRYGSKCQFAHGKEELRNVDRHPKFKTEICRTFWKTGHCPYAKRCCFIHTNPDSPAPPKPDSDETPIKAPLIARVGRAEPSASSGSSLGGLKPTAAGERKPVLRGAHSRSSSSRSHDSATATAQLAASKVREAFGASAGPQAQEMTSVNSAESVHRRRAQTLQDSATCDHTFAANVAFEGRHQRGASYSGVVSAQDLEAMDPRSPDSLGPYSPYSSQVTPPWLNTDLPSFHDQAGSQGSSFHGLSTYAPLMSRFSSYSSYGSPGSNDTRLSDEQSMSSDVAGHTDSAPASTVSTPITQPFSSPNKGKRLSPYDTPPRTPLRGPLFFKSVEPELSNFEQGKGLSGMLEGLKLDLGGGSGPSTPQQSQ